MRKSRIICNAKTRENFNSEINNIRDYLIENFNKAKIKGLLHNDWLKDSLEEYYKNASNTEDTLNTKLSAKNKLDFNNIFSEFLEKNSLAPSRIKQYEVIRRTLLRYELYIRKSKPRMKNFNIDVSSIDSNFLSDLYLYMENEHSIFVKHPDIYESIPNKKPPRPRSKNTMTDCFKKIRAFLHWCYKNNYTTINAFACFKLDGEKYGTPYYITSEELKQIYNTDLSFIPELNVQKDIFVFQCCIGCRISDLLKLTKNDIINGNIEYIPRKTIGESPRTVVVPLNNMASEIVKKYSSILDNQLLPFISANRYNEAIKSILQICKITRLVTILDPLTRTEKKVPINSIATSHMARRTFIGNIYKHVKDPSLVASLTGHAEGSKAFSRYRDIDTDIKKELVKYLD
ncbi:MAG: tyrosine-type recombinase/integrase [Bacteroidia bacterium]|nr:tyrosine-type recombinase/integrase [Bacteroidia bacterium]